MWARWCEIVLGLWLAVSAPWLAVPGASDSWFVPLALGVVVVLLGVAILRGARTAGPLPLHLLVLPVALALMAWGWARFPRPGPAVAQGAIVTGLVLALLSIVPDAADRPPAAWRAWVDEDRPPSPG